MKKCLLFLFILISSKSNSADWDLFQYGQKSYFSYPHYSGRTGVEFYILDSTITNGQVKDDYFRKKIANVNLGQCNVDSLLPEFWNFNGHDIKLIDSLKTIGDTSFYYSSFSTLPFFFFTNCQVGQSWTIASDYVGNDYSQISITCDSIYLETFLGITDSVKLFSFIPNGTSFNQVPINNFTMKLSKNYGMIELIPFNMFLVHQANFNFYSMQIIGLDNGTIQRGYLQPLFSDYFKLSSGDILLWQYHWDPTNIQQPTVDEFYRDTITAADFYPDSVVYTYDRVVEHQDLSLSYSYGNTKYFRRNDLQSIVESAPEWFAFGDDHYIDSYHSQFDQTFYYSTNEMLIDQDSISGDTITTIRLLTEDNTVDTAACTLGMTADIFRELIFNDKAGLISSCDYAWGDLCVQLVGFRINGIQSGNISLGIEESQISNLNAIKIFPNPSSQKIYIDSKFDLSKSYFEIFSYDGKQVMSSKLETNELSVTNLPSRIYFIKIISQNGNFTGKFIRE